MSASAELTRSDLPARANLNVTLAWLARRLPGGWGGGGFLRESDGTFVYFMKDPSQRDAMIDSLARMSPHLRRFASLEHLRGGETVAARWDFAELYDWSTYLWPQIGFRYAIVGWDIQESANRIYVFVNKAHPEQVLALEARLRELGVPCGLMRYALEPPAVAGVSFTLRPKPKE